MDFYNRQDLSSSQGLPLAHQKHDHRVLKNHLHDLLQHLKSQQKMDHALEENVAALESLTQSVDVKKTFKGLSHFQKQLALPDHSGPLIQQFQVQREGLQAQIASPSLVEDVMKMLSNGIQDLDELLVLVILLGRLGFSVDMSLLTDFLDKVDEFLANEALTAESMQDFAAIFAMVQELLSMINVFLDKPEKTSEAVDQRFSKMSHKEGVVQQLQSLGLDTAELMTEDEGEKTHLNPEMVEAMPYVQQFTQHVQALPIPKELKQHVITAAESMQDQQGSQSDSEATKRLWLSVMAMAILDDFKLQVEELALDDLIEQLTKRFPDDMLSLSQDNA